MESLLAQLNAQGRLGVFAYRGDLYLCGDTGRIAPEAIRSLQENKAAYVAEIRRPSLRFEMNPYQRSLILDELFNGSSNSVVVVLDQAPSVSRKAMSRFIADVRGRFPILNSRVLIEGEQFLFEIEEIVVDPIVEDAHDHGSCAELVLRYSAAPFPTFEPGMLKAIRARVADRYVWAIWMHHVVADAAFMERMQRELLGAMNEAPAQRHADFDFAQQNWYIRELLAKRRDEAVAFWRETVVPADPAGAVAWGDEVSAVVIEVDRAGGRRLRARLAAAHLSPLVFFAASLGGAASAVLGTPRLTVVSTFSQRNMALGPSCSGFYVNLVPFQVSAAPDEDPVSPAALARLDASLRGVIEYSFLPFEEILEASGLARADISGLINVIEEARGGPAPAPESEAKGRTRRRVSDHPSVTRIRRPLSLTVVLSGDGGVAVTLAGRLPGAALDAIAERIERHLVDDAGAAR